MTTVNKVAMSTSIEGLSSAQLRRVADVREQIEALEAEYAGIIGGEVSTRATKTAKAPGKKKRRSFSPETLAKMRAAQQARWAKSKGGKSSSAPSTKGKRTMSAEAKAKIAAAAKARWAKVRAAKNG